MERQRESEKRRTDPFLPPSIHPFLDCPSFRTLFLWATSMLFCLRLHKTGLKPIQDGNLEPLYRILVAPLIWRAFPFLFSLGVKPASLPCSLAISATAGVLGSVRKWIWRPKTNVKWMMKMMMMMMMKQRK
jgi:hypothetical protein